MCRDSVYSTTSSRKRRQNEPRNSHETRGCHVIASNAALHNGESERLFCNGVCGRDRPGGAPKGETGTSSYAESESAGELSPYAFVVDAGLGLLTEAEEDICGMFFAFGGPPCMYSARRRVKDNFVHVGGKTYWKTCTSLSWHRYTLSHAGTDEP